MFRFFKEFRFKMHMFKRIGAFSRLVKGGMSEDEALKKLDIIYPSSKEYLEFESRIKSQKAKYE